MNGADELLAELARLGMQVQARGDRLRYRPRSAMTPDLAERVAAHKPALLALLRHAPAPGAPQDGQNRPTTAPAPQAGRVGRPIAARPAGSADAPHANAPHELSLDERAETGYVNAGWEPRAWRDRLRQLADRCEALRPELAAQYRRWAANVLKNENGLA